MRKAQSCHPQRGFRLGRSWAEFQQSGPATGIMILTVSVKNTITKNTNHTETQLPKIFKKQQKQWRIPWYWDKSRKSDMAVFKAMMIKTIHLEPSTRICDFYVIKSLVVLLAFMTEAVIKDRWNNVHWSIHSNQFLLVIERLQSVQTQKAQVRKNKLTVTQLYRTHGASEIQKLE